MNVYKVLTEGGDQEGGSARTWGGGGGLQVPPGFIPVPGLPRKERVLTVGEAPGGLRSKRQAGSWGMKATSRSPRVTTRNTPSKDGGSLDGTGVVGTAVSVPYLAFLIFIRSPKLHTRGRHPLSHRALDPCD